MPDYGANVRSMTPLGHPILHTKEPQVAKRSQQRRVRPDGPSASAAPLLLVGALMIGALAFFLWRGTSLAPPGLSALSVAGTPVNSHKVPDKVASGDFLVPKLPAGAIANAWVEHEGHAVLVRPDQSKLTLTLVPQVQRAIEERLAALRLPYAAVVLMDPATGAILSWVERREPGVAAGRGLGLTRANAPAASLIKVVTASALLETGLAADHETCFHGGLRGLDKSHLVAGPHDTNCETMATSLARSSNAAFARLTLDRLKPGDLQAKAEDYLFQTLLDFDIKVQPSRFEEGKRRLTRARVAAGFGGARISPLHAAMLASTVANDGLMMRPYLVATDSLQPGLMRKPAPLQHALSSRTAVSLRRMLAQTVTDGTGSKAFARWPESLARVDVAGKTGTLAQTRSGTYRLYTWFAGMAPVDKPEVAVAALAVNGRAWRAKGVTLARDALAIWFQHREGSLDAAQQPEGEVPQGAPADTDATGEHGP